jgi:membrane associated rhomboid family serine protease
MFYSGHSGFVNAPVTKSLVVAVVFVTLLASIAGSHTAFRLHANPVLLRGELWRIVTHSLLFSTPGELLFGTVLLYFFRQFERQLSSPRFFALLFTSTALHTVFLLSLSAARPNFSAASGPYAALAACLLHYFLETPPLYTFKIFSLTALSDKAFTYALTIQLLISAFPASLLAAAAALTAALALRVPPLAAMLDTPAPFVALASRTMLPLLDTAPRPRRRSRNDARRAIGANAPAAATGAEAGGATPPGSGNDTNVQALTAMGFSQQQAQDALANAGNDLQGATERLLGA